MNDGEEHATVPATRASDAERDQVVARLQDGYSVGRLALPELEERVAVAYEARTRDQLDALVNDLPLEAKPASSSSELDSTLLIILLCTAPPAALVYWLIHYFRERGQSSLS